MHVLFVPEVTQDAPREIDGVLVVTGAQILTGPTREDHHL
jgi:hypothetical protein